MDVKKPQETSAVVLENLPDDVKQNVLTLLVENICSIHENEFKMELIPELRKAVVTFKNPSGKFSCKIYMYLYFLLLFKHFYWSSFFFLDYMTPRLHYMSFHGHLFDLEKNLYIFHIYY